MKTLVVGANGKIGRILCRLAAEGNKPVRALLRDPEQQAYFHSIGVETALGDLEGAFEASLEGCDRVVFTAGSGGKTGGDKTLLIDLYGAIRVIEACEARDIEQVVMVSAMNVELPLAGPPAMRHYFVAKKLADERLRASSVAHTILRPGLLSDEPATGKVRTDAAAGKGYKVSRENVALCILASLDHPESRGQTIDLLDGDDPIATLFAQTSQH
ncbi:MAG: SDR family oxidoreductase [Kiritimatiellia bacterium]|jgi:uncharacterized protein YbjT (DUF2867 family)|nr:SDR family oxidoreductase [Pseudomonadales bacterium]MDP6472605.1 SDR family oxidoreductase [Pseudomonadales bacterium]MDP6829276.1 SDR family oxidoreductase [Pseudomonadales bacterium]MDP7022798.1 SDR family oxidoreductase [Kiritimatiellia bacterium]|tara:strand:- start:12 stop:656 length:645 start_codon:yes stop_codon:yes gene_type:complete